MKTLSALHHKIRQAQYRHVKRVLQERFPKGEEWDKDEVAQIKAEFREFFVEAPLHEIARDYPDVAALLWVVGDSEYDLVPGATLVGKMGGVLLWADTPDEADRARHMIDLLAASQKDPDENTLAEEVAPTNGVVVPVGNRQSWWQRLFR